jgi:hypothetical protein
VLPWGPALLLLVLALLLLGQPQGLVLLLVLLPAHTAVTDGLGEWAEAGHKQRQGKAKVSGCCKA